MSAPTPEPVHKGPGNGRAWGRASHPLMRATVYHGASAPARRRAHRALADALAGEPLASQRAWHLAAAADGEDEQAAAALEDAAREARGRSGHAAAASAFERAARGL